jgi:hypothetical protein
VDDLDKVPSFDSCEAPRRSTLSLGDTSPVTVRILVEVYGLLLAEMALLITSSVAFLLLLRWRHADVWRSLGSPWFSYMQSFLPKNIRGTSEIATIASYLTRSVDMSGV